MGDAREREAGGMLIEVDQPGSNKIKRRIRIFVDCIGKVFRLV